VRWERERPPSCARTSTGPTTIFRELGIPPGSDNSGGRIDRFHRYLIEEYVKDNAVVLFIDEAQNTPVETLENMRMLSNLESSSDKLLQIVLCGQPELERLLGWTSPWSPRPGSGNRSSYWMPIPGAPVSVRRQKEWQFYGKDVPELAPPQNRCDPHDCVSVGKGVPPPGTRGGRISPLIG